MESKQRKAIIYGGIIILLLITLIGLLTGCEYVPVIDERCYDDYENFTFYEIEQEGPLGTIQSSYMFETPHGDIAVSDKTYEGAMLYEYAEICYERSDGVATTYLYTKKGNDLQPEPTIITEYEEVEVEVIVEVPVVATYENFVYGDTLPGYIEVGNNIGWILYTIDADSLFDYTDSESPVRINPLFIAGDVLIVTYVYEPHTLTADLVWVSQVTHYRYGMVYATANFTEEYLETGYSFTKYAENYIENIQISSLYDILYGGPE
jgi:hypothetical protein